MSGFYFLEIKKKISRVSKEAVKEKKKVSGSMFFTKNSERTKVPIMP